MKSYFLNKNSWVKLNKRRLRKTSIEAHKGKWSEENISLV
jgi:hypothetical protein